MQETGRSRQAINTQTKSVMVLQSCQILAVIIWISGRSQNLCEWYWLRQGEKSKQGAIAAVFVDWRNIAAMIDALQAAGWIYRGIVVWNKGNARNMPGRFRQDCEFIVCGTNGAKAVDWTPGFTSFQGFYNEKSVPGKMKKHQTEKPVGLLEKLVAICPSDGLVCDLFMGSGSTGEACIKTERNFIGIEMEEVYFEVAKERMGRLNEERRNVIFGKMFSENI